MNRERPGRPPRGGLVELVRFILVATFTAGGWQIAQALGAVGTDLLIWVVLGSGVGYVVGGVIGRRTATLVSAVEREFAQVPASEILAGVLGLILGLIIAVLISVLLFRLPPGAAYPTAALLAVLLGYLGYRLGRTKRHELFALFGLRDRAMGVPPGEVSVVDTSALIDGRILDVVGAGFVGGSLLVTSGVLGELQAVADASDPARRARGRRGLEVLRGLQESPAVDVRIVDQERGGDVDAALVRLARSRGAAVITGDVNLAKVAQAVDVPVRSLAELAEALRPAVLPGERLTLRLSKEGRERGQGVGYLEDGTMVVVEEGGERIGADVRAVVTNVLQTSTGRMVFARLDDR
ncbi:MAG TPA: PIN domain nuclease [Actinomycetota bacterium]|nr:PIN domain nuclease [Actinomycetota bacterium]